MEGGKPYGQALVTELIRKVVAEAIGSGATSISTAEVIEKVRALHPGVGISKRALTKDIVMAASVVGVALEIGGRRKSPEGRWRAMPSETC